MANRTRTNRNEFHLDNKKRYILDEKFKLSGAKSKSTLIRKPILYGYVYDMDYGFINNEFILFDGINQENVFSHIDSPQIIPHYNHQICPFCICDRIFRICRRHHTEAFHNGKHIFRIRFGLFHCFRNFRSRIPCA